MISAAGDPREAIRALLTQMGELSAALAKLRRRVSLGYERGMQPPPLER